MHSLRMISTVGLPGSPEETEKMEANRNKKITSGLTNTRYCGRSGEWGGGHKVLLQVRRSRKHHVYSLIWSLSTWLLREQDFI